MDEVEKRELISQSLKDSNYTNYTKHDLIGRGAYASVYKCTEKSTNMAFAMKKIPIQENADSEKLTSEVLVYVALPNHERLVQFYGSRLKKNKLHIFLEYISEGSLKDYLDKNGALPEMKVAKLTEQILDGIEHLHRNNIIHRDIKPVNILMHQGDNIKLTDFGLSKYVANMSALNTHTMCGTFKYMAPELLKETDYNNTVDIWSLGVTVIEMINGEPVYREMGPTQFIMKMTTNDHQFELKKSISNSLQYFLSLAFIKLPDKRPTATDMKHTKFIMMAQNNT